MSATNSSFNLPIENLILNYLKTGGNTIQLSVRAKDTATPITADIIRTTIYGLGSPEAQYFDNIQITGQIVLDGTIYADSQEQYWLTVRQQNPVSSLWSTCIVRLVFLLKTAPEFPSGCGGLNTMFPTPFLQLPEIKFQMRKDIKGGGSFYSCLCSNKCNILFFFQYISA